MSDALTKAQELTLRDIARFEGAGTHYAYNYPPIKRLLALGFISHRPMRFSDYFIITDAGRKALSKDKP